MNIKFQDKIDRFILHGDTMSQEEKEIFFKEIESDTEKKEQYEIILNIKKAIASREAKLALMYEFKKQYKNEKKSEYNSRKVISKKWILTSTSIAAILCIGIFMIKSSYDNKIESPFLDSPVMNSPKFNDYNFGTTNSDSIIKDTIYDRDTSDIRSIHK